jgi:hypothetical protein
MPKPWNRGYAGRKLDTRPTRQVLILCEDQKTAPNYLRKFPFDPADVLIEVIGTGFNADSLVTEAIKRKEAAEATHQKYIAVWCVLHRDSFPPHNFNRAFDLGRTHNIKIAYANQCFELWYWLHFDFQQSSVSRAEYGAKLSSRLGRKYHKADTTLYDELKTLQSHAIRNAKKLLSCYAIPNPEKDDPSTSLHILVEYLNAFSR